MASFNSFTLVGNLAADPEVRYTPSGVPICTFPIAVNSKRKNSEGKPEDHVDFFRITTKFKLADVCMRFLKKGRPVFVNGELESWRNEGKFGINFVATNVQFLGQNSPGQGTGGTGDNQDGWDEGTRQWAEDFGGDMPN